MDKNDNRIIVADDKLNDPVYKAGCLLGEALMYSLTICIIALTVRFILWLF